MADRKERESQKLIIDRQRVEIERDTPHTQQEKAQLAFELESKKLCIKKARTEIDKQKMLAETAERRVATAERNQIVSVFAAFAEKRT